uniref:Fork-head domain-containing protein n=1 Tax=Tetranychus urticae TaxID=32264 RepID=T1KUA2_TETUR
MEVQKVKSSIENQKKENQTQNVYPETHFVSHSASSHVITIFPESEDNKHEVNCQDDPYKLQSMTADASCDSLADVSESYYLKPKFSHNILCAFAILCGSDEEMMIEVSGIYSFLCKCFPYFETAELHWKNSLRHSLTTCNWFHKTELHRTAMKGYKWTINWNHKTCLAWEISKQCIKDVTSLNLCLSDPVNTINTWNDQRSQS